MYLLSKTDVHFLEKMYFSKENKLDLKRYIIPSFKKTTFVFLIILIVLRKQYEREWIIAPPIQLG